MIDTAYAMAAPQGGSAGQGSPWAPFVMMGIMFAIMYFIMIRPQQKRIKEHEAFVNNLERGTEVVTDSGIFGIIVGLTDAVATLEIAEGVKIKVERRRIASRRTDSQKDAA